MICKQNLFGGAENTKEGVGQEGSKRIETCVPPQASPHDGPQRSFLSGKLNSG